MSANLLYATNDTNRAEAFKAICLSENYILSVRSPEAIGDIAGFDVILCDGNVAWQPGNQANTIPLVAVFDSTSFAETTAAFSNGALDVLAYPFNSVEAASRLRCLSRLHMLRSELLNRQANRVQNTETISVLVLGTSKATSAIQAKLAPNLKVEFAADDITGLLQAAQREWASIILVLDDQSRDPIAMIRQLRALDRTRTTPILISTDAADSRCIAALEAGANDIAFASCSPKELEKRVLALALRKSVLDALRTEAKSIAPLSDFDHATGLPGPTQFLRTMPASLDRLKAQNKPASLLLIAIDTPQGMPKGQPVPDNVMLALTQVLRRSLRGFDYACRYSNDCFAILMPGADAKGAESVATRICSEIKSEKVRQLDGRKDGNTASIGLATMPLSGGALLAEQMIATALSALAQAQALGVAQIVVQEFKLAA